MMFEYGLGLLHHKLQNFALHKQMIMLKTMRVKLVLLIELRPIVLAEAGDSLRCWRRIMPMDWYILYQNGRTNDLLHFIYFLKVNILHHIR